MPQIALLDEVTIDKIAAGEVVERPSSVVKELVENAIDAGSTAITVEIKEGGISFIRITDNGGGIDKEQVPLAFLRHSTSKIKSAEDLLNISSLGFRGEALSSISAVSRVELITKTYSQLTGTRYLIEGSKEILNEEIGAPDGTTFIVKDLFYNTPARRKFLKAAQTEASYISDLVERLALSHPDISFKFINNNQTKLHTSGNGNIRDLIYHIYGREITSSVLNINYEGELFSLKGFIGKPVITRGNRNYENFFINGRYIKSQLLSKAVEDGYKNFLMQHQYPFVTLYFTFDSSALDVNVHPTKMEMRFDNNLEIYNQLKDVIFNRLSNKELIPEVPIEEKKQTNVVHTYKESIPEPFEKSRINDYFKRQEKTCFVAEAPANFEPQKNSANVGITVSNRHNSDVKSNIFINKIAHTDAEQITDTSNKLSDKAETDVKSKIERIVEPDLDAKANIKSNNEQIDESEILNPVQQTLENVIPNFISEEARKNYKIIGQLFKTYWLIEYDDKLFIIDQHAAHEKVLYEKTMKLLKDKELTSQTISPPIIISLDASETEMLNKHMDQIKRMGYEVEHFGGKEYMISAIPANLFNLDMKDLFIEMLDDFSNYSGKDTPELILEKIASMSCKAAVKGNDKLSYSEIDSLINDLLGLDNPYNCPHGRPTIISMTKYEIEKKFKRII